MMVIQWAGAIFLMILAAIDINWKDVFSFIHYFDNENAWILFCCVVAILAILNIACWIFAWWRYKNTQIIQRFMTK